MVFGTAIAAGAAGLAGYVLGKRQGEHEHVDNDIYYNINYYGPPANPNYPRYGAYPGGTYFYGYTGTYVPTPYGY